MVSLRGILGLEYQILHQENILPDFLCLLISGYQIFDSTQAYSRLPLLPMPLDSYMKLSLLAGFHSFPPRIAFANDSLVIIRAIFPLNIGPFKPPRKLWLSGGCSPSCFGNVPLDSRSTRLLSDVDGHTSDIGPFMEACPLRPNFFCIRALDNPYPSVH